MRKHEDHSNISNAALAACLSRGSVTDGFREIEHRYMALGADGVVEGCGLAAALIGMIGNAHEALSVYENHQARMGRSTPPPEVFADLLGLPDTWAYYLCMRHRPSAGMPAQDIAQQLERGTFFAHVTPRDRI